MSNLLIEMAIPVGFVKATDKGVGVGENDRAKKEAQNVQLGKGMVN